ncbi:MAG: sigma 54-interacting transcriptional regulator [Desulfobacteraceae bacterium]|nr:sigma 54-interacting transcriptional regulator [Desulfobacteraceae bacterium]
MDLSPHWKTIVDTLQDGVIVVDPRGKVLAVNPAAEHLTGYTAGELVGRSCRVLDCTGCEIYAKGSGEKWCGLYSSGGVRAKKCLITHKEHRTVNIIKNASVLRDKDGKLIGAVETLTDMSQIVMQQNEISTLKKTLHMEEGYHGLTGKSHVMQNLYELIDNVAKTEAPVIVYGESGTGKEVVARAIHEAGPRRDRPFVKVNCAALNENLLESELFGHTKGAYTGAEKTRIGRFEAAHGGSIFLDEIGDIPLATQVKLLRVLEEKEIERMGDNRPIAVDVRIISATHKNLENLIEQGEFREDLFFRINVFPLSCPPLRDKKEDIPLIVQSFIRRNNADTGKKITGLTPRAMRVLTGYAWQGNVRELRNVIEYAFVLCDGGNIDVGHLPPKIINGQAAPPENRTTGTKAMAEKGRAELLSVLRETGGNQSEAARRLQVSRITVWKRIKKYGIDIGRDI